MFSVLIVGLLVSVAIVFVIARLHFKTPTRQLIFLLASYSFYAVFAHWGIAFLWASTLFNFYFGKALRKHLSSTVLWTGIVVNLLFLAFFKYLPEALPGGVSPVWKIAMPLGLSFWTFQALSYLFDLYHEEKLDPNLREFALYMAFAPTVLSGPICRLGEMLPQFRSTQRTPWDMLLGGLQRVWLGVFMMALARLLGAGVLPNGGVDAGFEKANIHFLDVWVLAIGYGLQLYFDFAGYSNIVIGAARVFGLTTRENFESPYLSHSPSEFWTRWHMSLSFWIRDYLFLPLATRSRATWWRHATLLLSMVVFGIWHGAKWTFVLWGAYQGILLVIHRSYQKFVSNLDLDDQAERINWSGPPYTFLAICLGWLFFRADNLGQAWLMFRTAFQPQLTFTLGHTFLWLVAILLASYLCVEVLGRRFQRSEQRPFAWIPLECRFVVYGVIAYVVFLRVIEARGFVYLQF